MSRYDPQHTDELRAALSHVGAVYCLATESISSRLLASRVILNKFIAIATLLAAAGQLRLPYFDRLDE